MPVSDRFYYFDKLSDADLKVLAGFLNSSIGKIMYELHGRTSRGGLAEMMRYELEEFPVIDPSTLDEEEASRIVEAFDRLASSGVHEEDAVEAVQKLNEADSPL